MIQITFYLFLTLVLLGVAYVFGGAAYSMTESPLGIRLSSRLTRYRRLAWASTIALFLALLSFIKLVIVFVSELK